MTTLSWLPKHPDFASAWKALKAQVLDPQNQVDQLRALAGYDLEFTQILNIDRRLQEVLKTSAPAVRGYAALRIAFLSSSTYDYLVPFIRVAALRRRLLLECYIAPYNSYQQEILNPQSGLYAFHPDVVLFSIDVGNLGLSLPLSSARAEADERVRQKSEDLAALWRLVKTRLKATVIQETVLLSSAPIFGHLDNLTDAAPGRLLEKFNSRLKETALEEGILILDHEALASRVGKSRWMSASLWHHAKQLVAPNVGPLYGDHVARLLAGIRGQAAKCLVLDLDNTLWGGVIGDDGLAGIELGAGSGVGEAFQAFQRYALRLKERGVILAVCSKNDDANAWLPFDKHSEMVLKRPDIAVFVANWENKASNLKHIASELNIGLDAIVFFDDNPAERALVRQMLPMVTVHEVPEDPALFVESLADAGHFEAVSFTADDGQRGEQYRTQLERHRLKEESTDMGSFLRNLRMKMDVRPFDDIGRSRITQLINKSNQFNLTTRRYTDIQVEQMQKDPNVITLQVRLADQYGDNGMISVLIAKPGRHPGILAIDTWLMSCRVLGRQVEHELLNGLARYAREKGYTRLAGEYIATEKNGMVADHYPKLGFEPVPGAPDPAQTNHTLWQLDLGQFKMFDTQIEMTWHHVLEEAS